MQDAVAASPHEEVIRECRFEFHEDAIDKTTGELRVADRTDVIDTGSAVPPLAGEQVRVSFSKNYFEVIPVGSSRVEEELAGLLMNAIRVLDSRELRKFFQESKCHLVFSFVASGSNFTDPEEQSLGISILCLALAEIAQGKMDRVLDHVAAHGRWTFNWADLFALTFDSCQPYKKDGTGSTTLENFREQYKEAQQAREEIDAKREEWLHSTAEPLLDAMEEQLRSTDLPSGYRDELIAMHGELRENAYGYKSLIDPKEAAKIVGVSYSRFQAMVQEGRLGHSIARFYVHSRDEASRFAEKSRPRGRPSENE